jgi:hypothetical protein
MFLASASEGIIMRTMCLGLTPAVLSPPRPTSERKRRGQPRRHILKHEGMDLAEVKVKSLDGLVDLHGNPCSSEVHVFLPTSDSSEWILVPRHLIGPLSTYRLHRAHPVQCRTETSLTNLARLRSRVRRYKGLGSSGVGWPEDSNPRIRRQPRT